ncbi:hypothetical protein [Streptosporangium sp. NPDC087985]|uniref:hypothetical protein n=1 Tax=Streptosporangium sp. NPDC087985 TaxID=3366196 RepID=UPI003812225F
MSENITFPIAVAQALGGRVVTDPKQIVRPRLNWHGSEKTSFSFNGIRVERRGRRIHLPGVSGPGGWDAVTADGVGRVLIELAEVAAAEPDPALLEDLKEAIGASEGVFDDVDADRVARGILARFDIKKRPDGAR